MRVPTRRLIVLSAVIAVAVGVSAAHARPVKLLRSTLGPCGQVAANGNALLDWAKRTRVHQSLYADSMRSNLGMPIGDSISITLVTDSTTCAALARTLARAVAGRDTVSPNPVYALAVDTTLYLLADFHIDSPKRSDSATVGSARYYGAAYTLAVTVTRATGATRVWVYELVRASATPY